MRIGTIAGLTVTVIIATAARAAEPPPPAAVPPPDPSKAEGRYKNIQALKGHAADDVIPAMQFMANALGVECEFCHVDRAPEKDDKEHKQIARKMIAMTAAINQANFEGDREVTCVTCHRGAAHPVTVSAIAPAGPDAAAPAPAKTKDLPSASSVLDRYVQAAGGSEAMAKIVGHVQKGKLEGLGPEPVPVDIAAKAPDKRVTTMRGQRGDSVTAVNGDIGWMGNPGRPPRDMSAAEAEAARLDAALLFPTDPRTLFKEFEVTRIEPIDGKDAVKVRGRNDGRPATDIWFDVQSGLIVRVLRFQETPLGRNPTQIDIADYREADGVKVPFRWTVARPLGRFTIQLDESKNAPVEDKVFEKALAPGSP